VAKRTEEKIPEIRLEECSAKRNLRLEAKILFLNP
jgi:hypothetical protein